MCVDNCGACMLTTLQCVDGYGVCVCVCVNGCGTCVDGCDCVLMAVVCVC